MRKVLISEKFDYYEDRVVQRKWLKINLTVVAFIESLFITVPVVYMAYITQLTDVMKGMY